MIIDQLKKWPHYPFGSAWTRTFEFLSTLTPDSEETIHKLRNDDIFAEVSGYQTHAPESALFETHHEYIDIQTLLAGEEIIDVTSKENLSVSVPYEKVKDVEFFNHALASTQITLVPGMFALFFPHDAHKPGLIVNQESKWVKKVVVKVKKELLKIPEDQ